VTPWFGPARAWRPGPGTWTPRTVSDCEPGPAIPRCVVSWAPALAVAGLTALVFLRSLGHGFVAWDDQILLVENPAFRGLGWVQMRWMARTTMLGHYAPMTWLSFALDHGAWGLRPAGYHLTNVLIHAVNAALVYVVAIQLLGWATAWTAHARQLGAALTALVWALHPLRVEAVSWVTGRRDVLSSLFFLLALIAYLEATAARGARRRAWLLGTVGAYALALGSKAIVMTAPVALVALDVYPLRRLPANVRSWGAPALRGVWLEKIPLVVLAGLAAGASAIAVGQGNFRVLGVAGSLGKLSASLATPLWKTVWPLSLSPLYELPRRIDLADPSYWADGLLVIGISIAVLALRRPWPAGAVAWVWYLVFLAPVSAGIHAGPQITADRYSYLSILGPLMLVGTAASAVVEGVRASRVPRAVAWSAGVGAVTILAVLTSLTWRQQAIWRDTGRLWTHAATATPDCFICHTNLAAWLMTHDQVVEAVVHYEMAHALDPDRVGSRVSLGHAYMRLRRPTAAIAHYAGAVLQAPDRIAVREDLVSALVAAGRLAEAVARLDEGARFGSPSDLVDYFRQRTTERPSAPVARLGLFQAYVRIGDDARAREAYEVLKGLHPGLARASGAEPPSAGAPARP
jgi:protein O-mannosyl-transferase